jgi:integrase
MPSSPLCPIRAFLLLQHLFPVCPTDLFLSYRSSSRLYILTQSDLRRVLLSLVLKLGLDPSLTFHSFHHSASYLAHSAGLPLQAIQTHGTWSTDALLE